MKKIDNYKDIRRKAVIWGLSTMKFALWFSLSVIFVLTLVYSFSLVKLIVVLLCIGIAYLGCEYADKNDITQFFINNKFPKEISSLTEDEEED
ncbi:hypothetical protein [Capnocytophaga sp. oral taxon 878]|uniref:hypothetical protein n=1 Tax=Capnocytophaga sp. oral taxon 878 TaxID=1316596 RepID=UPI000D04489E|nr:hypothetical protein [Capnocytophaga sp. oral taxon 878]AVM51547.1 hypothetical protein C4H12_13595 [Capnocytophaga sp. oral taxon 878]